MPLIPWLVQPSQRTTRKIGNDITGIIEMPVRGGLLTSEDRIIGELLAEHPDMGKAEAELCDLIATAEGITMVEARKIIQDHAAREDLEDDAAAIVERHKAPIAEYQAKTRAYGYFLMDATVTALMKVRMGLPEWSMDDTRTDLARGLYLAIWEFAQEEAAAEHSGKVAKVTEESLGKPSAERPAQKRTGKSSSGS